MIVPTLQSKLNMLQSYPAPVLLHTPDHLLNWLCIQTIVSAVYNMFRRQDTYTYSQCEIPVAQVQGDDGSTIPLETCRTAPDCLLGCMGKKTCLTIISCTNCILCSEVWLLYVETHEKMDTQELLGKYHQVETPCIVGYSNAYNTLLVWLHSLSLNYSMCKMIPYHRSWWQCCKSASI